MHRRWAALASVLVATVAVAVPLAGRAGATHDDETLWVTIAINAAGADRIGVRDETYDDDHVRLTSAVAVALGHPPDSFRAVEDFSGADAVLDRKLAVPDGRGRLSYSLDSGQLQVMAQRRGYESVAIKVCAPKVRQVVNVAEAAQPLPAAAPSRCRGWFRLVDERPVRAVLELSPDRHRYPSAVARTVGAAAITFGLLGMLSTLLRHGPMRRRSVGSWLLAAGSAVGVSTAGWAISSVALWWTGATADPLLLGGGSQGEQVARTLLPGLAFLVPALLPGAVLLSVPRREPPAPPAPPSGPPVVTWWPVAWWPQWAAQQAAAQHAAGAAPPSPAPHDRPPPPEQRGWALPGSGGG